LITVASNGIPFVKSLEVADVIIDYRSGEVPAKTKEALNGQKLYHAFDVISGSTSFKDILGVIEHDPVKSHLNMLDRPHGVSPWPPKEMAVVNYTYTFAASAYGDPYSSRSVEEAQWDREFSYVFYR
jgi:NADPH:quinone reductase